MTPSTHLENLAPLPSKQAPVPPAAEVVETDGVSIHTVAPGVSLLRGDCAARLKCEVEYGLKRGTTENCYLVQTPDAQVLIDVPYEAFSADFVAALSSLTPPSSLTHIIITQLDPKAIPTLEALLRTCQAGRTSDAKLQVVLSNPALRLLQSAMGEKPEKAALLSEVNFIVARSGAEISLGASSPAQATASTSAAESANVLQLVLTPTPRWPDLMCVHYPQQQLIFTSQLLSSHAAPSVVGSRNSAFDVGGWDVYGNDWHHFFDCMLAPVAKQAAAALDKLDLEVIALPPKGRAPRKVSSTLLKELWRSLIAPFSAKPFAAPPATASTSAAADSAASASATGSGSSGSGSSGRMVVATACPMHGPVITSSLSQLLREYREWTDQQIKSASTSAVTVMYASAYGNTAALAQAISRGITKGGVGVNTLNLEVATLDEVQQAVNQSQGFIIGSPTLGGHMPTQVQVALGDILRASSAKELPCGVFGSFGWSGEAVDEMESRLRDAGFGFAFKPIRVKFKPTAKDLQLCEESGRDLAVSVKKKLKIKEVSAVAGGGSRAALASGGQLAMGRVVGSLCVITAKQEDASSAMLASWISQASFDPPGITVSIKKDRALFMGNLLSANNRFTVSMIPEGRDRGVMKRLARTFAPGEDRLAGLDLLPESETGTSGAVLKDANSYIECEVVSRLEAGDHYVLYANVLGGKVLAEGALTAVHHRKVGNHY
ncbi:MAG: hypothetical protein WDW38_004276 [Sanguina aurantia]